MKNTNNCHLEILCPMKISFKDEGKIKTLVAQT